MELGAAGATVYCTGRSVRGRPATAGRTETIEETADLVTAAGGRGIAIRVDHTTPDEVAGLFERLRTEHEGRLDILVNDVWGGDELTEWGKPFWELTLDKGLLMLQRGIHSHLITSRLGAPLLVNRGRGLIVEVTDGDDFAYRGNLYYDLVKVSVIRMAFAMAKELRTRGVAAVALTPGFLRSERILDHFGVTEATWRDATRKDPYFAGSETPHFIGRAVASLAADRAIMKRTGRALATWDLAEEYGFPDIDGRRPHWGRFFEKMRAAEKRKGT